MPNGKNGENGTNEEIVETEVNTAETNLNPAQNAPIEGANPAQTAPAAAVNVQPDVDPEFNTEIKEDRDKDYLKETLAKKKEKMNLSEAQMAKRTAFIKKLAEKRKMWGLGAPGGDEIGCPYEYFRNNVKERNFPLWSIYSVTTDDGKLALTLGEFLAKYDPLNMTMEDATHTLMYMYYQAVWDTNGSVNGGWGQQFRDDAGKARRAKNPPRLPTFASYANGGAMRVGAVISAARTLQEVYLLSEISALPSHGDPNGIDGATVIAVVGWLAKNNYDKTYILDYCKKHFPEFDFDKTIEEWRADHKAQEEKEGNKCPADAVVTVPIAVRAFLEGDKSYKDVVQWAVYAGGDSDTIGAMAGAIAEAVYGIPDNFKEHIMDGMNVHELTQAIEFDAFATRRQMELEWNKTYADRMVCGQMPRAVYENILKDLFRDAEQNKVFGDDLPKELKSLQSKVIAAINDPAGHSRDYEQLTARSGEAVTALEKLYQAMNEKMIQDFDADAVEKVAALNMMIAAAKGLSLAPVTPERGKVHDDAYHALDKRAEEISRRMLEMRMAERWEVAKTSKGKKVVIELNTKEYALAKRAEQALRNMQKAVAEDCFLQQGDKALKNLRTGDDLAALALYEEFQRQKSIAALDPNLPENANRKEEIADAKNYLQAFESKSLDDSLAEVKNDDRFIRGDVFARFGLNGDANVNPKAVLPTDQRMAYDSLFKEYAGSSSKEYQKLEATYRQAAAFDPALDYIVPGLGDLLRQKLHEAAAAYYNAKLPQEQNTTRRNRMELARGLFRDTAPNIARGEPVAVQQDVQPEYQPLPAAQVSGAERADREVTVLSYRNDLRTLQQRMENTESRFFNNDSKEYKTMTGEVRNMLGFLNGTMLGPQAGDGVIDLNSSAFQFRLNKLKDAAANYFDAKLVQDKNTNRQTRFDIAEELMNLPDLSNYRPARAAAANVGELEGGYISRNTLNALDVADPSTAASMERFLNNDYVKAQFEVPDFERRELRGEEESQFAVRGGKKIYDLLKKEQEGRDILRSTANRSPAELALARRDVLLGAALRDYMIKTFGPSKESDGSDGPLKKFSVSIGKNPAQLDNLKKSLLQKAADVAALEKKIQDEGLSFRASAHTLADPPQQPVPQQQPAPQQPAPQQPAPQQGLNQQQPVELNQQPVNAANANGDQQAGVIADAGNGADQQGQQGDNENVAPQNQNPDQKLNQNQNANIGEEPTKDGNLIDDQPKGNEEERKPAEKNEEYKPIKEQTEEKSNEEKHKTEEEPNKENSKVEGKTKLNIEDMILPGNGEEETIPPTKAEEKPKLETEEEALNSLKGIRIGYTYSEETKKEQPVEEKPKETESESRYKYPDAWKTQMSEQKQPVTKERQKQTKEQQPLTEEQQKQAEEQQKKLYEDAYDDFYRTARKFVDENDEFLLKNESGRLELRKTNKEFAAQKDAKNGVSKILADVANRQNISPLEKKAYKSVLDALNIIKIGTVRGSKELENNTKASLALVAAYKGLRELGKDSANKALVERAEKLDGNKLIRAFAETDAYMTKVHYATGGDLANMADNNFEDFSDAKYMKDLKKGLEIELGLSKEKHRYEKTMQDERTNGQRTKEKTMQNGQSQKGGPV